MATKVIDNDKGWLRIKKQMKFMKSAFVQIGYPGQKGVSDTIMERAAIHQYGTRDGRIPARPFMSQAFDKFKGRMEKLSQKVAKDIIDGKYGVRKGLKKLGVFGESNIKRTIKSGSFEELKDATSKAKGSSKPLIDTGQLRNSVTSRIIINK